MKRFGWWILAAGVAVVLPMIVGAPWIFDDQISVDNFDTIGIGMTEAEVVEILGRPADDDEPWRGSFIVEPNDPPYVQKTWHGRRMKVALVFGANGTVQPSRSRTEEITLRHRIERWMGSHSKNSPHSGVGMLSPDP